MLEVKNRNLYLAAFFVPVVIVVIGFAICGVYPFGSGSALVIDGVHQYLGFYEELVRQLQQGSGFFYSDHALGYNFYSLYAYYLTSPFNLLVLFFRMFMNINEAVTLVILMKIGLSSLCMTWYMRKKMSDDFVIPLCMGMMYALSNYILGYYSNVMWLECVMLLPVLAYMIEQLVENGKWKGYSLVLAYCIFSNYYMGFLLCVFSALYFCVQVYKNGITGKNFLKYTGASMLSAGMTACILLPSFYALQLTDAGKQMGIPNTSEILGSLVEQFSRLSYESYPYKTSADQASVNIYCGCCVIFLLCMYFRNTRIQLKEKVAYGTILWIYLAGFHFRKLNLLLHGLHKPVGMPNRFAFIFIFILLCISAKAWKEMSRCKGSEVLQAGAAAICICMIVAVYLKDPKIVLTVVWIGLFIVCSLSRNRLYYAYPWTMILLIVIEVGSHAILSISNNGIAYRNTYIEKKQELTQLMSHLDDKAFFRTDLAECVLRNEELLYQLNGCSLFSSTNTAKVQKTMKQIGCDTGKNWHQYDGASELMDMLLGVRYVVCDKGRETVKDYIKVAEGNRFVIFKNPWALQNTYYLRQGKTFSLQNRNPMVVQNRILREMGMDKLYDIQTVQAEQGTLNPLGKSIFKVSLQQGEHAYLYLGAIEPDMVTIDGKVYRRDDTNTFFVDLGYAKQTKTITVRTDRRISRVSLGVYSEMKMEQIYRKLSERQFHIAQGKNTVSAESEGVLFLNSFYDENQVIKIDGKEQKVMDMGGFIGIPVKAGKHSVEIRYCVPGLFWGILISFFSCMAWIKIVVLRAFSIRFCDVSRISYLRQFIATLPF